MGGTLGANLAPARKGEDAPKTSCLGYSCIACCVCYWNPLGLCWPMHGVMKPARPKDDQEEMLPEDREYERQYQAIEVEAESGLGDTRDWPSQVMVFLAKLTVPTDDLKNASI